MNVASLRATHLLVMIGAALLPACAADVASNDPTAEEDALASKKPNIANLVVAQAALQGEIDFHQIKKQDEKLYDLSAAQVFLVHGFMFKAVPFVRADFNDVGYYYLAFVPKKGRNVGICAALNASLKSGKWTLTYGESGTEPGHPMGEAPLPPSGSVVMPQSEARAKASAAGVPASAKAELVFFPSPTITFSRLSPFWEFHWGTQYAWVSFEGKVVKKLNQTGGK